MPSCRRPCTRIFIARPTSGPEQWCKQIFTRVPSGAWTATAVVQGPAALSEAFVWTWHESRRAGRAGKAIQSSTHKSIGICVSTRSKIFTDLDGHRAVRRRDDSFSPVQSTERGHHVVLREGGSGGPDTENSSCHHTSGGRGPRMGVGLVPCPEGGAQELSNPEAGQFWQARIGRHQARSRRLRSRPSAACFPCHSESNERADFW